jgi:hypothetical protein
MLDFTKNLNPSPLCWKPVEVGLRPAQRECSPNVGVMTLGHLKKIVGDRPHPPHEKGPTHTKILFSKKRQKTF